MSMIYIKHTEVDIDILLSRRKAAVPAKFKKGTGNPPCVLHHAPILHDPFRITFDPFTTCKLF